MKVAELEKLYPGIAWRYCFLSKVKHGISVAESSAFVHNGRIAVCGTSPEWHMFWHGAGKQEEYDRLDELRECKKCIIRLEKRNAVAKANLAGLGGPAGGLGAVPDSAGQAGPANPAG